MAVLASKAPYGSMGMGPTQPSVVSQYAVNFSNNHKTSAAPNSQNAAFLSPTESEFSEPSDAQDSIRYAIYHEQFWEGVVTRALANSDLLQLVG